MGTVTLMIWAKLNNIHQRGLKLILQNGTRGETGIALVRHVLFYQISTYCINTQVAWQYRNTSHKAYMSDYIHRYLDTFPFRLLYYTP